TAPRKSTTNRLSPTRSGQENSKPTRSARLPTRSRRPRQTAIRKHGHPRSLPPLPKARHPTIRLPCSRKGRSTASSSSRRLSVRPSSAARVNSQRNGRQTTPSTPTSGGFNELSQHRLVTQNAADWRFERNG